MPKPGVSRPRYQGLRAARRWVRDPGIPREPFSLAAGERIGNLTIIGHLARGRVTELYQVWSDEHWAALTGKMIAPEHVRDGAPPSFRQEERTLRALNHPNIVRLFGSGTAEGRPFLLLEYFSGPTLLELLEGMPRRRLSAPDAIRATMHVGAAVNYLHRQGFVYRDLKPANILLREGIPILVDFDVAKRLGTRPARDRQGTAPYMAPEQVRGEPLSAATDVYGLGAVLYEMLSGHWPTEEPRGEDDDWDEDWDDEPPPQRPAATSLRHMGAAELEARYPQLVRAPVPLRHHLPRVRRELEAAVLRALHPDPAARFRSVAGMLAALAPLLRGANRLWPPGAMVERRAMPAAR